LAFDDIGKLKPIFLRSFGQRIHILETEFIQLQQLEQIREFESESEELNFPTGSSLRPKQTVIIERKWDKMSGLIKTNKSFWLQGFELLNLIYESDTAYNIRENVIRFKIAPEGAIERVGDSVFRIPIPVENPYAEDDMYLNTLVSVTSRGNVNCDFIKEGEWEILAFNASGPFQLTIAICILATMTEIIASMLVPLAEPALSEALLGTLFGSTAIVPLLLDLHDLPRKNRPFWWDLAIMFYSEKGIIGAAGGSGKHSEITLLRASRTLHCFPPLPTNFIEWIKDLFKTNSNVVTEIHVYGALDASDQVVATTRTTRDLAPEFKVQNHVQDTHERLCNVLLKYQGASVESFASDLKLTYHRSKINISGRLDLRILLPLAAICRTRGCRTYITDAASQDLENFYACTIRVDDVDSAIVEITYAFRAEIISYIFLNEVMRTSQMDISDVPLYDAIEKGLAWYFGHDVIQPPKELGAIRNAISDPKQHSLALEKTWNIILDKVKNGIFSTPKIILTSTIGQKIVNNVNGLIASLHSNKGNLPSPVLPFELLDENLAEILERYSEFAEVLGQPRLQVSDKKKKESFNSFVDLLSRLFPTKISNSLLVLNPNRILAFTLFPLELLKLGESYLGLKVRCGRIATLNIAEISDLYNLSLSPSFYPIFPLRVAVIAPRYSRVPLDGANGYIQETLDSVTNVLQSFDRNVLQISYIVKGEISKSQLIGMLKQEYDLIFYIGHAKAGSLISSTGEEIRSSEISRRYSSRGMSIIIGCETGADMLNYQSVAKIFLTSGMRNVVATYFRVAAKVAEIFLTNLLIRLLISNQTIGEATLYSRIYTHLLEVLPSDLLDMCPKAYIGSFMAEHGVVDLDRTVKYILDQPEFKSINYERWKLWESEKIPQSLFFLLLGDPDERLMGQNAYLQSPTGSTVIEKY
jgi:hypothetical protein